MKPSDPLAVRVAEVDTGLAPGLGGFAFLFLVFSEFLVGVGERVARGEHGVASRLFFLFAQGPKFVADLADGTLDDLHFDEQIADFFEKVVKMIGAKDVGKARRFQTANVLAASQFWNEIQDADAATRIGGDAGQLTPREQEGAPHSPYIRNGKQRWTTPRLLPA